MITNLNNNLKNVVLGPTIRLYFLCYLSKIDSVQPTLITMKRLQAIRLFCSQHLVDDLWTSIVKAAPEVFRVPVYDPIDSIISHKIVDVPSPCKRVECIKIGDLQTSVVVEIKHRIGKNAWYTVDVVWCQPCFRECLLLYSMALLVDPPE